MTKVTESHVRGATDMPLTELTIGAMLDQTTARWPDHEAIVVCHQGIRWTYAEMKPRVDAFAAGLLALGLRPGDRIGIWSPNNIEWIITQFASAKAGLILVTINPGYRLNELEYALNKVGCKASVTAAMFKSSNYLDMLTTLAAEIATCAPGQLRCERAPSLETLICIGADAPSFALAPTRPVFSVSPKLVSPQALHNPSYHRRYSKPSGDGTTFSSGHCSTLARSAQLRLRGSRSRRRYKQLWWVDLQKRIRAKHLQKMNLPAHGENRTRSGEGPWWQRGRRSASCMV